MRKNTGLPRGHVFLDDANKEYSLFQLLPLAWSLQHVSTAASSTHNLPTSYSCLYQHASFPLAEFLCECNEERFPLWRIWLISARGLTATVKMWSYCYSIIPYFLFAHLGILSRASSGHTLWFISNALRYEVFLKECVGLQLYFAHLFISTSILVTDDGRKDDSALPHLS